MWVGVGSTLAASVITYRTIISPEIPDIRHRYRDGQDDANERSPPSRGRFGVSSPYWHRPELIGLVQMERKNI